MPGASPSSLETEVKQLVWYITGTSSGMGKRLVPILLARGDKVIATARTLSSVSDLAESDNLRKQQLDVTDGAGVVKRKVDEAATWFGRIDVVVNNAGIGAKCFTEEGGSEQYRRQYNVNVFGALDVTNAVLPYMRAQRSGTVVLVGSRTSWFPELTTAGLYGSSKAALRVIGETLAVEVAEFNIRVLIVEPGAFRTENIFSQKMYDGNQIPDYDELRAIAKKRFDNIDKFLLGDPVKAMELLADVVRGEGRAKGKSWPLYLPLGKEAEDAIRSKAKLLEKVLDDWGEIVRDTRLDNP
ncbi:hypothetical protein BDY19DRAFT_992673 [Irpex rosettiformis]|uniref:Uncharacterized protein n=1 Tax=Irpex rosettiformis TaxID=378272 RepID=A0ACB8U8B5_9APHY|nr:hypothetical protein BDY19DRAFT_992673 [Irpex rosettiformis]